MATPILSKPQPRKSLSAKKHPVKGLKNVLGQPYENYWPVLSKDNATELENLLRRLLVVLKKSRPNISWNQLRKMSKEERSAAKKAVQANLNDNYNESVGNSVIFGINAITRSLEKEEICSTLLDCNVDPALLVKHVVSMAKDNCVPVVLLPHLKKFTLETIGFPCAALALKTEVQESIDNDFYPLFQKISELSQELMSSEIPMYSCKKMCLEDDNINENQDSVNTKKFVKKDITTPTNVYLYRQSKKERIFKPPASSTVQPRILASSSDFIPLGNDKYFTNEKMPSRFFHKVNKDSNNHNSKVLNKTSKKDKHASKNIQRINENKISYKPLKVKRLQGNEFRTKATKSPKIKKTSNV